MQKHKGFTLVELVVVVMILGILAAVAAPKLLGTSSSAAENGLKQTLAVVRDAIERHAAEKGGALPRSDSESNFKDDLKPYLRGAFPVCPVALKDATVKFTTTGSAELVGEAISTTSWWYHGITGQFICNSNKSTKGDPTITYDKL